MPHLSFEYNDHADKAVDMAGFAAAMRDALDATGAFPLKGIRVRGYRADVAVVADGGPHGFVHMTLKIGRGRDAGARAGIAEAVYAAAEAWLRPQVGPGGFALSLELAELPPPEMSIKRWNTVADHMGGGR